MAQIFPTAVYVLCFLTSAACALLLTRSYRRSRARLLLWSALFFAFLALNNLAVIFDMVLFPNIDFRPVRHAFALAAVAVLLFGFIWDLDE